MDTTLRSRSATLPGLESEPMNAIMGAQGSHTVVSTELPNSSQ